MYCNQINTSNISQRLIAWQRKQGRHQLPWQSPNAHLSDAPADPYPIWVSEIMLQQTQVKTVIPYFIDFMKKFPNVQTLAKASLDDVLASWSGLGYYTRARSLYKAAQQVCNDMNGVVPKDYTVLQTLCGIGRTTAAAIAVFSQGQRHAILDANVKRVLARHYAIIKRAIDLEKVLLPIAYRLLPFMVADMRSYTQGLMDLGATVCTRKPQCNRCPLQDSCLSYQKNWQLRLPLKKKKRRAVHKNALLLLITIENNIMLIPRPEKGIWGGLWSLPQVEDFREGAISNQYPISTSEKHKIASFLGHSLEVEIPTSTTFCIAHKFTHFATSLWIVPLDVSHQNHLQSLHPKAHFISPDKIISAPLPAPQKKWLQTYFSLSSLYNKKPIKESNYSFI